MRSPSPVPAPGPRTWHKPRMRGLPSVRPAEVNDETLDPLTGHVAGRSRCRSAREYTSPGLASIHGQYRVTGGASMRKVLLDQERWELSKLPAPGLKEHLSDAIVACPGEDARIVR